MQKVPVRHKYFLRMDIIQFHCQQAGVLLGAGELVEGWHQDMEYGWSETRGSGLGQVDRTPSLSWGLQQMLSITGLWVADAQATRGSEGG